MEKANIGNNEQEIIIGGFMVTNTERLEEFKARRQRKSPGSLAQTAKSLRGIPFIKEN